MSKSKSNIIFTFLVLFCLKGSCQFYSEENANEAKDMAAICNSFTFLELYKSDTSIIPEGYAKRFTSVVYSMDNKYQIYQTNTKAVINFRGSTAKKISWMENIYSSMIPAKGKIKLEEGTFVYEFSTDENAGVHAGYALGIACLAKDVINNIKRLNHDGIYEVTITGHSQGGALAILLRAYLENLPDGVISEKNTFKTYAFAHPKVGNKEFVTAYTNSLKKGSNYSVVNVKDYVPKMPLSQHEHKNMTTTESLYRLLLDKSYNAKDAAMGTLEKIFGGSISRFLNYTSESAFKQITKKMGEVKMPDYIEDVNYAQMGERIELTPFEFPKILNNPEILKNDSLVEYHQMNENGIFEDESVYRSEPAFFQHKTYNYYTGFLKNYYPKDYQNLEIKVLPENL